MSEVFPSKEILEVGKYDDRLLGDHINCKDWNDEQVKTFIENLDPRHDLKLPVGFIENIEKDPYQLYCDTDSVIGESLIYYGENPHNINHILEIEKLWNGCTSIGIEDYKETKEIKNISELDLYTPTFKDGKIINEKIIKIIRHKVSKKLWKISCFNDKNKNVVVTEDHSIIIANNLGKLFPTTIKELIAEEENKKVWKHNDGYHIILNTDAILFLNIDYNIVTEIADLWIEEINDYHEYVYDLEVENNPVFFANGILVHNSDYLLIKLTFNKQTDHKKTVDYCQKLTIRMNTVYMNALDLYFYKIANWHPDFNTMDFKSEVVAFRGFFNSKKFYALGKIWDEGKFLDELEVKVTGGQYKKSDITQVTKEMLAEVYHLLTKDTSQKDVVKIYNIIFTQIKNKYIFKLREAIKDLNFEYFTIPKKWSFGEKKNVPAQITGAKLYNRIIKESFSVGDSVLQLPIKYNMPLMKKEFEKTQANENMLQDNELTVKIKDISLPPLSKLTDADKDLIKKRFNELQISVDIDDIMTFNIDMKLEPFKRLFNLETIRKAKIISET